MIGAYVLTALIVLVLCGGVFAWAHEWFTYRRDDRNPYRRYCRHCGQRQEVYCHDWAEGQSPGWWENMSPLNTTCKVGHKAEDRL
jgi:hypothetical protein